MSLSELKEEVHAACLQLVLNKMKDLEVEIKSYQDSANQETKSSAGDKYETGRAMIMLEKEKLSGHLMELRKQAVVLQRINPKSPVKVGGLGSLIATDVGSYYFISIGLGIVQCSSPVFCISPLAPVGKLWYSKKVGDDIVFNKQKVVCVEMA